MWRIRFTIRGAQHEKVIKMYWLPDDGIKLQCLTRPDVCSCPWLMGSDVIRAFLIGELHAS